MAKKTIEVGGGYAVRFEQRARGEETPYFVATILRDGAVAGSASNGGRGGATLIRGPGVQDAFTAMVEAAAVEAGFDPKQSLLKYEPASAVLSYALCRGYERGCAKVTLVEFVNQYRV